MSIPKEAKHIGYLDGIRGLMAFWVLAGHLEFAMGGASIYLVRTPNLAVDVFMFLSGFLMAWHWYAREKRINNFLHQTKDFYIRRFFRVAPLYYILITVSLFFHSWFDGVYNTNPFALRLTETAINNPTNYDFSLTTFLVHYTFLFGLFPAYCANNILPDWSLSLEMQFYAFFPLIVVLMRHLGDTFVVILSIILTIASNRIWGTGNIIGIWGTFPSPSLLVLSLSTFMVGIILARFLHGPKHKNDWNRFIILYGISLIFLPRVVAVILLIILYLCVWQNNVTMRCKSLLSHRFFVFCGDVSYGVYLCHWMALAPAIYLLGRYTSLINLSPTTRFMVVLAITVIPIYGIAYLLHIFVEKPGIRCGKIFIDERTKR